MSAAAPKILLVEDNPDVRDFLKATLESDGFQVFTAANGIKLISNIRIEKPDLILLDIELPWVDGFELCKAVKAHPDYRRIPIIFVSVRTREEDIRAGMACGADDYITKPIDIDHFFRTIRKHLPVAQGTPA